MKTYLKMVAVICVSVGIVFSGVGMADDSVDSTSQNIGQRGSKGDRPPRGNQELTDEQKAAVASILSNYDASALTAEDAKAIHTAFREAGLRPGPGMKTAIESAGFDPETLRKLDPPPNGGKKRGPRKNAAQ